MQRRHDADLGGAIKSRQHGLAIALVEIADRSPVHLAMAAVDVTDQFCQFVLQIAVGFDCAARRRCDLQQRHRARQRRMQCPHAVECLDAVDQPLGIIQPVDADRELFPVQASPQPRHVGMRNGLGGLQGEFFDIDADREYRDARLAMTRRDDAVFDLQTKLRGEIAKEVLAVVGRLESDQIIGQHRLDQFAMMRHPFDDGVRGPRRMQEKSDRLRHAAIAQFRAERQEMIILNPERGVGLFKAQQRARHEGVDFAIADIILLRSADQIGARMQRWPQCRVRKAFVISAVMRGRQIQRRERTRAKRFDFGERFLLGTVADAARGTYPDRAGFLHHRQQRGREPSCHGLIGRPARYPI